MWRKANLVSDNLGINVLLYGVPVVALLLLFTFTPVNLVRVDFLVVGVVAIIGANVLINFESEVRSGARALILALGSRGAFV